MDGDPPGQSEPPEKGKPPKRRPTIIRIFRALKGYENRHRRRSKQEKSDRDLIMARWTRRLGIFTGALVTVSVVTGTIFFYQLTTMQGQLNVMEVNQRPWVSLNVELVSSLSYDAQGWDAGVRWHGIVRYQTNNVGKRPATDIGVFGEIIPFTISHWKTTRIKNGIPKGAPIPGTDVEKEISNICSFSETMHESGIGTGALLFPQERPDWQFFGLNGNQAIFDLAKQPESEYGGNFLVVICVIYYSVSDTTPHRTGRAYDLFKTVGSERIDLSGETIPLGDIGFVPHPINGSMAN